jgi:hypothetical protein
MKIILLILPFLLFLGCSTTCHQELTSYKINFLRQNDTAAQKSLQSAIEKADGDYDALGVIYLSECGLNKSLGIDDGCEKFKEISSKVKGKDYQVFVDFLNHKLTKENIKYLSKNYHDFATHLLEKDYKKANEDVRVIEPLSSQLVSAYLLKDHIETQTIKDVINNNYYYGYKRAVLFWLKELKARTSDEKQIAEIEEKISSLK